MLSDWLIPDVSLCNFHNDFLGYVSLSLIVQIGTLKLREVKKVASGSPVSRKQNQN